jgi:hypothetical protein
MEIDSKICPRHMEHSLWATPGNGKHVWGKVGKFFKKGV